MAITAQEWTISALSAELRRDRRTLGRIISDANVAPIRSKGKSNYYRMADVVNAMIAGDELDLQQEQAQLARERTRRLKIENDEKFRDLIPVAEVIDILQNVAKIAASILDALPLNIKRRVPALKARDIEYIKLEIAKARNAIASAEVKK